MTLDPKYLDGIKKSEGYTPRASWDYKQHSIGYGTRAKFPGETIDREEAERRLAAEITSAAAIVDRFAPNLDPGTRAALTSLTFNAGSAWTQAGLGQAIKAGDLGKAREIFLQYNKAGGQELPGLVARRQREAEWFGNQPAAPQIQPAGGQTQPQATNIAAAAPAAPESNTGFLGGIGNMVSKAQTDGLASAVLPEGLASAVRSTVSSGDDVRLPNPLADDGGFLQMPKMAQLPAPARMPQTGQLPKLPYSQLRSALRGRS